ncbi:MAG: HAD-IA family hydrolase [Proteobacteria bacterium]|nr:HAD-IA family hydrolase [Pseudomonadota bacterium]
MKISDYKALTFDCYGTLIDWETGIADELRIWAFENGIEAGRDEMLEAFGAHEYRIEQADPGLIYPEVLKAVHLALQTDYLGTADEVTATEFGRSVPRWPAFPDISDALGYLKQHYKLVILSNVDRVSFASSNKRLGVHFDAIVTAQDVGSYKPDPRNFDAVIAACAAIGVEKDEILHTAQSVTHDIVPGRAAGLATCWIDRRHDRPGWGATKPPEGENKPDFTCNSMYDFTELHRQLTAG